MEYLYFSSRSLTNTQAVAIFNSRRASYRMADACLAVGPHGLVTNGQVAAEGSHIYALFGTAFVNNRFINNFAPRESFETIRACKDIRLNPQLASGIFTAIIADQGNGDAAFLLDDLNASPCFTVRHGQGFAISSNVHMLADWLAAQGVRATRTVEPALSHLVFSSGQTSGNLYHEIQMVRPEELPEVCDSRLRLVRNNPVWPSLLSASYDELIDEAARVIRQRIKLLTETGLNIFRVFDLTGGMDSRIILAAIIGSGVGSEWRFHNYYPPRHPDSNFSHFVAERFGIRQWPKESAEILPAFSKARVDLYLAFGTELKGAAHANLCRPDYLHVTGAFGELGGKNQDTSRFRVRQSLKFEKGLALGIEGPNARRAVSATSQSSRPDSAILTEYVETYLDHAGLLNDRFGFNPAMLSWARKSLRCQIEGARQADLDFDQMPVIFYRRGKARSHFGMDAYLRTMREQYSGVLNTPYATAAAVKIGSNKSRQGRINLDLIRRLGGDEIASLPLVDTQWHASLFSNDAERSFFMSKPVTSDSPPLFRDRILPDPSPSPEIVQFRSELWGDKNSYLATMQEEQSNSVPANRRIAELRTLAAYLLREGPVSREVAAYLPESSVRRLVASDPTAFGTVGSVIHVLQFFCQSELWMRGMEEAPFDGGRN